MLIEGQRTPPPTSASALFRARMVAEGGYRVYSDFPGAATRELLDEAMTLYPEASHQECWDDDHAEGRGGRPRRKLLTNLGGPVQDQLYRSEWLPQLLSRECGCTVTASGNRGSYSYYVRPGDFLDLHLDVDQCDITLIAALHDNSVSSDPSGALVLYPGIWVLH